MSTGSEIKIDSDYIRYGDNIIKNSNISRMYIVKFYNKERENYRRALKKYEENKRFYEAVERDRKITKLRNSIVIGVLFCLAAIFILRSAEDAFAQINTFKIVSGFCFGIAAICILIAFFTFRKKIEYHVAPPEEEPFPERHGLFIELNSGKSVVFTALDELGKQSLRILRDNIIEASSQQKPLVFNMTENHISVENNDGIIALGDHTDNTIEKEDAAI